MIKKLGLDNILGEIIDYGMTIYIDDKFKIIYSPHTNTDYDPYIRIYIGRRPFYIDDQDTKMTRISLIRPEYIDNVTGDQNLILDEEDKKYLQKVIFNHGNELIELMKIVEKDSIECPKFINDSFCFPDYSMLKEKGVGV